MRKAQLDNLTRGTRPTLHASTPNWDTLKGLVERAGDSLSDARQKANSSPTRFAAAYSSAFWTTCGADCAAAWRLPRYGQMSWSSCAK